MPLKPKMELADLQQLYEESTTCDKELFAEQRTNVLLVAGEHYARRGAGSFWGRQRSSRAVDDDQKIRLTKNHTYRISKTHITNILSLCPDVSPLPANETDLSDVKAAELHKKVKTYYHRKLDIKARMREFAQSFYDIGEMACKIFFDPDKGRKVGFEPVMDEQTGEPVLDEIGQMIPDEKKPVYSGDFVVEEIYGYNLLRDAASKRMEDSPYLTTRKMVKVSQMKIKYKNDPKKAKMFEVSEDKTYVVFDTTRLNYGLSRDECMVMETYIRPCPMYPEGYYYYFTDNGIFEEDTLPFGVFPIIYELCDTVHNHPRGRSPLKHLRPYQIEINRSASKVAEHQITLGDDKIIMQNGTTMQQGMTLPGIRGVVVNGAPPTILEGRDGARYAEYANSQITEMYNWAQVDEKEPDINQKVDPYALLYRSASQKKKYGLYVDKFENFQKNFWMTFLDLARHYMPDDELVEAVGRTEAPNLAEFRNPKRLSYIIGLEPQAEDVETKLGRQLTMTQVLQYVGGKLEKEDIGKFMRQMPFANVEKAFDDFTLDYDAATTMILSLDRGEVPPIRKTDDAVYMSKRLTARVRGQDFMLLPPNVQNRYEQYIAEYDAMASQIAKDLKAAESDFIPTGGGLVAMDIYVPDPKNANSQKRARVPYEAVNWLLERLEQQGTTQDRLSTLEDQTKLDILRQSGAGQPPMQQPPISPQAMMPPQASQPPLM